MKKVFMLIALVAFLGVNVAPVVAMVNDVTVELGQETPKKAEKEAKKSECATSEKAQKAEAKSGCAPACESKSKTVAEKEAACGTSTKAVAKKEGEKK